ncbi:hypothetical protein JCM10212_001618 [Sporobolomyces blumeae]
MQSTSPAGPSGPGPAPAANSTSTSAGVSSDLWSTILDSVKGSRGVGTKQCIVLGAPRSGKSTLVDRISNPSGEANAGARSGQEDEARLDLGMSYSVLDVKDEGDEESLARMSVYQLPSPHPPFPSLLPLALSKETFLDSLIVIVLDWERPWSFVAELAAWITMLERAVASMVGNETWEMAEAKERLEKTVRNYQEPAVPAANGTPASSTAPTITSVSVDADGPLPAGSLTDNLGLRLVVVCAKADHINSLERDREFTEDQFDYIQQVLRTVCLRYGAALFYTSQTLPSSYSRLRQYILHRLFSSAETSSTAPPTSSAISATSVAVPSTTSTRAFSFSHRPNVVDRDEVVVPTGWDSHGKIRILKDKFDCEAVGERWERDLESERELGSAATEVKKDGLKNEYGMVVVDFDAEDKPHNSTSGLVSALDEQSFLATHYTTLQAEVEKDPRLAFRQTASTSSHLPSSASMRNGGGLGGAPHGLGPSVVGPMAGATLDLPSVQGALDRASAESSSLTSALSGVAGSRAKDAAAGSKSRPLGMSMSRQDSTSSALPSSRTNPLLSSSVSPGLSASASHHARTPSGGLPSGATGGAAGTAAGGNQVLADFFQSLLTARSGSTGSGSGTPAQAGAPSTSGGTGGGGGDGSAAPSR